jgi:hypothetical protein
VPSPAACRSDGSFAPEPLGSFSLALATWQRDKKRFAPEALKPHQDNLLGNREAWQFITKQPVRIRRYWATEHEVQVEMLSPGRLHGSVWWVDDKDCAN